MDKQMSRLWQRVDPAARAAFFSCFMVGYLAHLFAFANLIPNADGLSRVYDPQQMTVSGRWFLHYASALNDFTQMPAAIGLVTMVLLGLAAALTVDILKIRGRVAAGLWGAIMAAFPCLGYTFLYMFTASAYALAILLAAGSVWLARRGDKWSLLGPVLLALAMGIYQAYVTVAIGLLQGFGYYALIKSYGLIESSSLNGVWVALVIVLSFTAGSAFLMWLGEQITEFGVGNGISIILFAGIVSRFPRMISDCVSGVTVWSAVKNGTMSEETLTAAGYSATQAQAQLSLALAPWMIPVIVIGMLALVVFIVFISNAERRLPVQYAKRVVGRKMYGGQSTHIPMKVNMSGVMPIIFAQSIAALPATIGAFAGWTTQNSVLMRLFDTSKPFYSILYFLLIVGFSYFYATMQFNPVEVSNNLKKNGGFIPGFRPGKPTADFITKVLNKITMFGALYLSVVAIAPIITGNIFGYHSLAIGGTSVIIVVGVALETVKQMEAQMLMRHYKGFLE